LRTLRGGEEPNQVYKKASKQIPRRLRHDRNIFVDLNSPVAVKLIVEQFVRTATL
jgi:hypothetical protein